MDRDEYTRVARFVTNTADPRVNPDVYKDVVSRCKHLSLFHQGPPKATDKHTAEELFYQGMIGLYELIECTDCKAGVALNGIHHFHRMFPSFAPWLCPLAGRDRVPALPERKTS